jgi:hypothetical protein
MWDDIRAQQLADNIRQDFDLLKSYEDELRYASEPRTMAKYQREIKRQRDSLARNQQEYAEIMKSAQGMIESHPIPETELQDTLTAIQQTLSELRQSKAGQYNPKLVSEVEEVSGIITNPKLDPNHKLKYSIPIIPQILSYEGEMDIQKLKTVWQSLKARLRGNE